MSGGAAPVGGHTPGPWDQRREYDLLRDEIGVQGRAIAVVWVRKADGVLNSERVVRSDAEREANARLIVAAPTMYETLRTIYSEASEHPLYLGDDATEAEVVRAGGDAATITAIAHIARNAMKEATGGSK